MSTHDDPRRSIAAWLEAEAPDRAPTRLVEASRARVRTTPQRRAWWLARRAAPMSTFARLGVAAATVALVGVVGVTLVGPLAGPAASPLPPPSPSVATPTASPRSEAETMIAEGNLQAFAQTDAGTLLTIWDTCQMERDTDCGIAWRIGTGPQAQASGVLSRVDFHPDVVVAGDGFILTQESGATGVRIDPDGTTSPVDLACGNESWSTPTAPGRLAWTLERSFIDTVTGSVCRLERLGGRPLSKGGFTSQGVLLGLVDNESDPDGVLTVARYDGTQWREHELEGGGGSLRSVIAVSGSTAAVLRVANLHSYRDSPLVGFATTTDAGATWSEEVYRDGLSPEPPFAFSPDGDVWNDGLPQLSAAFAGPTTLYVADWYGGLWRSTDLTSFSKVGVPGAVQGLQSAGDAVIARYDAEGSCPEPAACRLNDLVRIDADGTVEPITIR